ncbi:putative aldehyde dehydrogenase, partial [Listeria grayi FSL F6-1183]
PTMRLKPELHLAVTKNSGIGRETHKMILDAYTQAKNIYINLNEEKEGLY